MKQFEIWWTSHLSPKSSVIADIAALTLCANSRPEQVQQTEFNYSITTSARASSSGGTSSPSALAVLRFTASSLHWQIGRLGPLQDLIDVESRLTKLVVVIRTVSQEAARLDVFPALKGGRQARDPRKL